MSKPAIFNMMGGSRPWLPAKLAELFDVRAVPGPGIRAAATDGIRGMTAGQMDALPDLEMIAVQAVGYDKVDIAHARTRNIRITNTPDVLTDDVADIAIGLMLAVGRRIVALDSYVRAGRWGRERPPPLSRTISGRRIGILGLGRIGTAIARRAAPFAGELGYFARHHKSDLPWRHFDHPVALAQWSDILIVALAGGAATAGLVDRQILDALGRDGIIVNIARGSVIDENAMVAALQDGRLAGAGLDVFAREPLIPAALLAMDNVVLLPHQGSATIETRDAMAQLVLDNLSAFFAEKPLLTPIF